jgi:ribosomal protein S18 acetylase RimI-like enzyme
MFKIIPIDNDLKDKVVNLLAENWGSSIIVTKGKIHRTEELQGFAVLSNGDIQGLITYDIVNGECEVVSLDSLLENQGIGTSLIDKVIEISREKGCTRVWLITTNDNTKAIRFYQRRGFDLIGLHVNAIQESRKIKPQIPLKGFDDIPILHEIEFQKVL